MVKGRIKYVPNELLEELQQIKMQFNFKTDIDAFRELTKQSIVGREINFRLKRK